MHPQAMARLRELADVDVSLDYAHELFTTIAHYDGMIVYSPRFDPALLGRAQRLKVIACHACPSEMPGAATARGIRVDADALAVGYGGRHGPGPALCRSA